MLIWWAAVLTAVLGLGLVSIVAVRDERPLNVRLVAGDGTDLWAKTYERVLLQGNDVAWWVSHDGGATWSEAEPPELVEGADPLTEVCNPSACHRLVDGWRVERRRVGGATWEVEYERSRDSSPTDYDGYVPDWEEVPAIATTDRVDGDEVVVAAGQEGALVRTESGSWRLVPVGEPLLVRYLPWLFAFLATMILLCGVAGHFVIRWWTRRARHASQESAA